MLPQPPPPPQPSGLQQPSPQGPPPYSGLSMSPPNPGADIIGGFGAFMTSYLNKRESVKTESRNRFMEGLMLKSKGIPVDDEKLMKYAQKAGMDYLQTEPHTPEQKQVTQQNQAQQQAMQAVMAPGSMAGMPMAAQVGMQQQAAAPPQAMPQGPAAPGGFMNRVKQMMGMPTRPVGTDSPMGEWLAKLGQAGQAGGGMIGQVERAGKQAEQQGELSDMEFGFQKQFGMPLKGMGAQQQQTLLMLAKDAMSNRPTAGKSMEMLARASNGWQLPMDEWLMLGRKMNPELPPQEADKKSAEVYFNVKTGVPQMQLAKLQIAKDLAPHYGGSVQTAMAALNGDPNAPAPTMDAADFDKFMSGVKVLSDRYPTAPLSVLNQIGLTYTIPGGEKYREPLLRALQGTDAKGGAIFPTRGSMDEKEWRAKLGFQGYELKERLGMEMSQLNWQKLKGLMDANQAEGTRWFNLQFGPERKNATDEQVKEAAENFAKVSEKMSGHKIKIDGSEFTIGNPQKVIENYSKLFSSSFLGWNPTYVLQPQNQGMPLGQRPGQAAPSFGTPQGRFAGPGLEILEGTTPEERRVIYRKIGVPADIFNFLEQGVEKQ